MTQDSTQHIPFFLNRGIHPTIMVPADLISPSISCKSPGEGSPQVG